MILIDSNIPSDVAKTITSVCQKYEYKAYSATSKQQFEAELNAALKKSGWCVHISQWFSEESKLQIKLEPPPNFVQIEIGYIQ